jgi:hypothetical protein
LRLLGILHLYLRSQTSCQALISPSHLQIRALTTLKRQLGQQLLLQSSALSAHHPASHQPCLPTPPSHLTKQPDAPPRHQSRRIPRCARPSRRITFPRYDSFHVQRCDCGRGYCDGVLPVCQLMDRVGKHHLLGTTVTIVAVAGHAGYDMEFLQGGYPES